jgi:hypothetical protein
MLLNSCITTVLFICVCISNCVYELVHDIKLNFQNCANSMYLYNHFCVCINANVCKPVISCNNERININIQMRVSSYLLYSFPLLPVGLNSLYCKVHSFTHYIIIIVYSFVKSSQLSLSLNFASLLLSLLLAVQFICGQQYYKYA